MHTFLRRVSGGSDTPPPVLLELRNLAEFHAARAQFEVTVDIEHDVKWVPSFLAGERVQFVAVGTVDAVADFRALDAAAVTVDADTSTVTVTLGAVSSPAAGARPRAEPCHEP